MNKFDEIKSCVLEGEKVEVGFIDDFGYEDGICVFGIYEDNMYMLMDGVCEYCDVNKIDDYFDYLVEIGWEEEFIGDIRKISMEEFLEYKSNFIEISDLVKVL